MFLLVWRKLKLDPLKTLLTALALGSVIAVMLVFQGFREGQYFQLSRMVMNRQGDLIAVQAGVSNFIAVRSTLPQFSRGEVEAVPGVSAVHPLTTIGLIYEQDGIRTPLYLVVYDTLGGPVKLSEGRTLKEDHDIIIDKSLAKKHNLKAGDELPIYGFGFKIVGIVEEEVAFMMPFAYASYEGMLDLYFETEIAPDITIFPMLSFMLIEVSPESNREDVAKAIEEAVPVVDIFTPEQLSKHDVALGKLFFGPIIGLLVTISSIIGFLVMGLIMYSEVNGEIRNYGIMKALGFSNLKLAGVVIAQALLLVLFAMPAGLALGAGLAAFINETAPLYLIRIFDYTILLQTALASLIFAAAGAMIPFLTVQRADPMIVFQEVQ
ncbi:MAG: ABC transporter permease [bacterium]|nr:ABC transporter permease [bacterium]